MPDLKHQIQPGECALSLSAAAGHFWKTVWDHAENQDLRSLRQDPGVLLPGDVLFIRGIQRGEESASTEKRHRFRVIGRYVELRVRVHELDGPRKQEPFHVEIDDVTYKGTTAKTSDEGLAVCRVPADAREAVLVVGKDKDRYELQIGFLDPLDTVTGVHGRLENLGYETGGVMSAYDETSVGAAAEFLSDADAEGNPRQFDDPGLQKALKDTYTI